MSKARITEMDKQPDGSADSPGGAVKMPVEGGSMFINGLQNLGDVRASGAPIRPIAKKVDCSTAYVEALERMCTILGVPARMLDPMAGVSALKQQSPGLSESQAWAIDGGSYATWLTRDHVNAHSSGNTDLTKEVGP